MMESLRENLRSPAAWARFLVPCILGLAVDLWTKALAVARLKDADGLGRPGVLEVIPGWLNFTYVENLGAVFGLGQGWRWMFVVISMVAIGFLTYLFASSGRQRFYQIVLGMLLAGVLGNMYDRLVYGHVRDMIHALPGWTWPGTWSILGYPGTGPREVFPWVFNVADTLLCVGVGVMVVYSLFGGAQAEKANDVEGVKAAG